MAPSTRAISFFKGIFWNYQIANITYWQMLRASTMRTSKKIFQPAVLLVFFFKQKHMLESSNCISTCLKVEVVLCKSEQCWQFLVNDSALAHEILPSNNYKIICCPLITHLATSTLPKHSDKSTLKIANTDTKGSVPFLPLLNYRMWLNYKCQCFHLVP